MQSETEAVEFQPSMFYQHILNANADLQSNNPFAEITPENIDAAIDVEMKKMMSKYTAEEEDYVDQKLVENPVVCERRPSNRSSTDSSSSPRDALKQKRAESSRKSRMNNKIKKAKSIFRHNFITLKLAQVSTAQQCLRSVIAGTENRLLRAGYSKAVLEKVRQSMSLDRMETDNLSELTDQLSKTKANN